MERKTDFFIDGKWVAPASANDFDVINPANETPFAMISLGSEADVNTAVAAAKKAFPSWSTTPHDVRIGHIETLAEIYKERMEEMATAISTEMGAPKNIASSQQAAAGLGHIKAFIRSLKEFTFEHPLNDKFQSEYIIHEPIGVCGLITPWNWPMNQVTLKVVPAVGVGCTVLLKPSEIAPMSSLLFAEFMEQAGFPAGVFNLVNGDGPTVGEAMSRHPDIDMMSFTGSTRAGIAVTKAAADTVKRIALELGGKGPNLVFADTDVAKAVKRGVLHMFNNSGQSCNAPSRMIVEKSAYAEAIDVAKSLADAQEIADPTQEGRQIGPVVSQAQYDKIQRLIDSGIKEGATLLAGGLGRPDGLNRGYYVKPTVFADVKEDMTIAQEEIFGPVLSIMKFEDEADAVRIANNTPYGLTSYVQTGDTERAKRLARQLRAGMIQMNGANRAPGSPFGGFKQSGNGREGGTFGLMEFLEVKAVSGWPIEPAEAAE